MLNEYKIIRNFISPSKAAEMADKLDHLHMQGKHRAPDDQCPISPSFYGVFNDELGEWTDYISKETNIHLLPAYSYARIYQDGEFLAPHYDRFACEISFSLTLKYEQDIWPFWFHSVADNQDKQIMLDVGDIIIYKGPTILHWRLPLQGQKVHQAFFHFVEKDGKYADQAYDGEERLLSSNEVIEMDLELLTRVKNNVRV